MLSFKKRTLKIKINFLMPDYISMNVVDPDRLRVFFRNPWFFVDKHERQRLADDWIDYIDIERQFTDEQMLLYQSFE